MLNNGAKIHSRKRKGIQLDREIKNVNSEKDRGKRRIENDRERKGDKFVPSEDRRIE
jgi:hypothetical protein